MIKVIASKIIIGIIILINISCSEDSISPDNQNPAFSLNIKVIDSLNNVMPNMKIGSYYHPSHLFDGESSIQKNNDINASTTIQFTVNESCLLSMQVYDLENKKVKTLIESNKMELGVYQIQLDASNLINGVYKYVMIAEDTLNQNILFADSSYFALLVVHPNYNGMGFTNNDGLFISNNKQYFPSLYTLPEQKITGENGPEPIGTFTILDTITIVVTDTSTNTTYKYIKTLGDKVNNFILVYGKGELYKRDQEVMNNSNKINTLIYISTRKSLFWNLTQNYPNPFN